MKTKLAGTVPLLFPLGFWELKIVPSAALYVRELYSLLKKHEKMSKDYEEAKGTITLLQDVVFPSMNSCQTISSVKW